tara:strand:- start:118 stop:483 length:366 start_codon:yes stop_codon:yes gene_type:complete
MMSIIRFILGRIILILNQLTLPKPVARTAEQQIQINQLTQQLSLYEMLACPYCVKVRREFFRLGLNITTVDVKKNPAEMDRLVQHGGKFQVPCLKIVTQDDTIWLYESEQIIQHVHALLET